MKEGRKPEYPEKYPDDELPKMPHTKARRFKNPDDELQIMPHTKARRFKPQPRLKSALWLWRQARKFVCWLVA